MWSTPPSDPMRLWSYLEVEVEFTLLFCMAIWMAVAVVTLCQTSLAP
jgi:hypothetical protein